LYAFRGTGGTGGGSDENFSRCTVLLRGLRLCGRCCVLGVGGGREGVTNSAMGFFSSVGRNGTVDADDPEANLMLR